MPRSEPPAERQRLPTLKRIAIGLGVLACLALACVGIIHLLHPYTWPPPVVGQNCGTIRDGEGGGGIMIGDPGPSEDCLWHAYTICSAATLMLYESGVDTGDSRQITVQPARGGCAVAEAVESYGAVTGTTQHATYACAGLEQMDNPTNSGLILTGLLVKDCGEPGYITIPRYPAIIGQNCEAIVNGGFAPPSAQAQCFWQAYTHCQLATLPQYPYTLFRGVKAQHFFTIRPANGACTITDDVQVAASPGTMAVYTCGALRQVGGGLVVQGCGDEGDVVVVPGPSPTPTATPAFPPT